MVKLDAPQLWEVMFLIFGTESVVDSGCHEDSSRTNGTSDELVILACDGGQDGRVENRHEAGKAEKMERA